MNKSVAFSLIFPPEGHGGQRGDSEVQRFSLSSAVSRQQEIAMQREASLLERAFCGRHLQ